jgi:hypothetical protein
MVVPTTKEGAGLYVVHLLGRTALPAARAFATQSVPSNTAMT